MRLAINTSFATRRWPRAADWTALVRDDLALDTVQVSTDVIDPTGPRALVSALARDAVRWCERRGIQILSLFGGMIGYLHPLLLTDDAAQREDGVAVWRCGIQVAGSLGARFYGSYLGQLGPEGSRDPGVRQARIAWAEARLGEMASLARRSGLEALLVEPTPVVREFPGTIADTLDFLDRVNSFGPQVPIRLNIDVGHACRPGGSAEDRDLYAWIRRVGAQSPIVHLQQTDGRYDRHWPFSPPYRECGIVDPERVRAEIDAVDPGVWGCLEIMHPPEEPDANVLADIATSVEVWKEVIARG